MMRRFFLIVIAFAFATISANAQLYVPGETLNYRMSYRAKLFPNTEVAKVTMRTTETTKFTVTAKRPKPLVGFCPSKIHIWYG